MESCATCGLVSNNGLFHPKVGKPFDSSTALSLVCQYAGSKPCLNKCTEIKPNSDSWAKRAQSAKLAKDPWETNFLR